jgi:hypothetical protein
MPRSFMQEITPFQARATFFHLLMSGQLALDSA